MTRRAFDRFMVMVELAGNPKIARLDDAEFRCLVSGVWPLAAKATPRGALRVATLPAGAADVAHQARKSEAVAKRTLEKLRQLGMLEHDDELGCEIVHDWDEINPGPKPSDSPEAARDRKQKERDKKRGVTRDDGVTDANVTRDPSREVEVEEQSPPKAPPEGFDEWLADHATVTGREPPRAGTKARTKLEGMFNGRVAEKYTLADLKFATRGAHGDDYRRENGYDRAESVLRPEKVHDLVENGKRAAQRAEAEGPHALVERLNRRTARA